MIYAFPGLGDLLLQTSPIDWGVIVGKVPEVALALLVVIYSLEMSKHYRESSRQVMAEWRAWLTAEEASRDKARADRDALYLGTLKEIKDQSSADLKGLTDETKEITRQLAGLTTLLTAHDIRSQEKTKPRP